MAKESSRLRGVVVRFNHQKGYGFIKPNNGGDNLFVHHSDIKTEGFATLHKDLSVEFVVQTDEKNNKKKAVEVTGINGSEIKIVRKSVSRGSGIGDCYNCGEHGHMARDCRNASWCYYCRKHGHRAKDCERGECYNCGGSGHLAKDCTYTKNRGERAIYNCYNYGGSGHFGKYCKHTKSSVDGASYNCYNCGGSGHFARDCTSTRRNCNGACYNCGEEGHLARECPKVGSNGGEGKASNGGGGRRGVSICFSCGLEGHFAKDCQNE